MDIPQVLFSFSGRINRLPYWLIPIGVGVPSGVMAAVVEGLLPDTLAMLGSIGLGIGNDVDRPGREREEGP